jgi:hypothetical protein
MVPFVPCLFLLTEDINLGAWVTTATDRIYALFAQAATPLFTILATIIGVALVLKVLRMVLK